MYNPFTPNPFQMVPHEPPPNPTWGTDMLDVPSDVNALRQYYQSRNPNYLRNLGVPPVGTPEFESFIQYEYNQLAAEQLRNYNRNGPPPAMPSRNAILPFIPGVGGMGALWQQMQQGGQGPFGDQQPPPYGPYGPARPFMVPDENMGGRY